MNRFFYYLKMLTGIILISAVITFTSSAQESRNEVYYYQQGQEALLSGQPVKAVNHLKKADSLHSNNAIIMRALASACSQADMRDCTFSYLQKLGLVNADTGILRDSVFQKWDNDPSFDEINKLYQTMNKKITSSDTAFTIPEKDLHPEAIAFDPRTDIFYISSIHKRKVIRRHPNGAFSPLATEGLQAASGMQIDTVQNSLWLASPATPHMTGFKDEMQGNAQIIKLDLLTGKVVKKYSIDENRSHFFGDLIIHSNNNIYITDSFYPAIYTIDKENDTLQLVKHFEHLYSLQGITFIPYEDKIYFADYVEGIFRYDLKSGNLAKIESLPGLSLKGIDGLYYYRNSLIAIQNGVRPMRITLLNIEESGTKIKSFKYLEKNNPVLDEPTLGTIVGNTFYYIANSPWGKYDQDGNMLPPEKLEEGLVLKISLPE